MSNDGMKFVCEKCERRFPLIPISHGVVFMRFAGRKPKPSEMCNGEIISISEEIER